MSPSLETWAQNGWLRPHRTSPQEIAALIRAADEDLASLEHEASTAWRFIKAYTAALRLCSVALFASGYEAVREQRHYRTITALSVIVGAEVSELVETLDQCRAKRHDAAYESGEAISESEADELASAAHELREKVRAWLSEHHPELGR